MMLGRAHDAYLSRRAARVKRDPTPDVGAWNGAL